MKEDRRIWDLKDEKRGNGGEMEKERNEYINIKKENNNRKRKDWNYRKDVKDDRK